MSQGHDGLVGNLKAQVALLEQKLNSTRETTKRLQGQLETQKTGYEEQIGQLEAQIMELFRMLKEVGKGYEKILDSNSGTMDRKNLIENLNKYLERSKTISILEGRGKKKKGGKHPDGEETKTIYRMTKSLLESPTLRWAPRVDPNHPRLSGYLEPPMPTSRNSWMPTRRYSLDEIIYSSQSHRVQGKWAKQEMPCCMPNTSRNF
jgi:hypothetical protein